MPEVTTDDHNDLWDRCVEGVATIIRARDLSLVGDRVKVQSKTDLGYASNQEHFPLVIVSRGDSETNEDIVSEYLWVTYPVKVQIVDRVTDSEEHAKRAGYDKCRAQIDRTFSYKAVLRTEAEVSESHQTTVRKLQADERTDSQWAFVSALEILCQCVVTQGND